jgi:hypothetical protein
MLSRHGILVSAALSFAFCFATPAEATKAGKQKKPAAVRAMKHRHSAVAATPGARFQNGVLAGPLYNGQDYLGDDPDPNIRAYLMRDMSRYGGTE